jgi:hypothetical protein
VKTKLNEDIVRQHFYQEQCNFDMAYAALAPLIVKSFIAKDMNAYALS